MAEDKTLDRFEVNVPELEEQLKNSELVKALQDELNWAVVLSPESDSVTIDLAKRGPLDSMIYMGIPCVPSEGSLMSNDDFSNLAKGIRTVLGQFDRDECAKSAVRGTVYDCYEYGSNLGIYCEENRLNLAINFDQSKNEVDNLSIQEIAEEISGVQEMAEEVERAVHGEQLDVPEMEQIAEWLTEHNVSFNHEFDIVRGTNTIWVNDPKEGEFDIAVNEDGNFSVGGGLILDQNTAEIHGTEFELSAEEVLSRLELTAEPVGYIEGVGLMGLQCYGIVEDGPDTYALIGRNAGDAVLCPETYDENGDLAFQYGQMAISPSEIIIDTIPNSGGKETQKNEMENKLDKFQKESMDKYGPSDRMFQQPPELSL